LFSAARRGQSATRGRASADGKASPRLLLLRIPQSPRPEYIEHTSGRWGPLRDSNLNGSPAPNAAELDRSATEGDRVVHVGATGPGLFVPFAFPSEGERLLALNPRGTRCAVSWEDADSVQVFDVRSGREVARCQGFQRIVGIEFLSANALLVTAAHGCLRCDL